VGAIRGESSKTIRDTEAALNEALAYVKIQEIMRDLIHGKAKLFSRLL